MASLADLKLKYRLFMKTYRYRKARWDSPARLEKPLSEARVAVVTTAAFYLPNQEPFDESIKGGDVSFREIEHDAELRSLEIAHKSDAFDHEGIALDKNVALPLDRLRELAREGVIGELAPRHYSFQGSITAPGALVRETAPEVARRLLADNVDVVLLTPV